MAEWFCSRPSGDSKHSAKDLIEIVTESMRQTTAMPIGVEASIGIYQAFDVGANEMRPSVNDYSARSHSSRAQPFQRRGGQCVRQTIRAVFLAQVTALG